MGYRIASRLNKDRFVALIAGDRALTADSLRAAFALVHLWAARPKESPGVIAVAGLTGFSVERTEAALAALVSVAFVEADGAAAASLAPPRPRRAAKGARLGAEIMDYELDIDGLIRAGDANIRGRGAPAPSRKSGGAGGAGDDSDAAAWGPLKGEETQPAAMRFMVWLRFVLGPDELAACDRFALTHKERWKDWIARFSPAKGAGMEDELLDDIRRSLHETAGADAAPAPDAPVTGLPRPN